MNGRQHRICALALGTALLLGACKKASSGSGGGGSGAGVTRDLGPGDPGPGGVRFAASGEVLALSGYDFPPATPDDVAFVDGWQVKFSHLLVTVDDVTLSENPDFLPGDPSQTGGVVARVKGPWAIDLAHADPGNLPGKGDPSEQAVPFASIKEANDGSALATDGTRYAFGFDVVAATPSAKRVNLTSEAAADYDDMVTNGCAVLYVGTATFKGDKSDPSCYPPDRQGWPDTVTFRLCFKSPTSYVNCQNPENKGPAFANEESQRGVALKGDSTNVVQVTMHTDHPFWDSVTHDSPAHFDQFAARVTGQDAGASTPAAVTLEMTKGVDYTAYTDAQGHALDWRYCIEPPTDVHPKLVGAMRFDPGSVPHASGGDATSGLRDYYDFSTYDQSTQGHLNTDGLCFVRHGFPAPP